MELTILLRPLHTSAAAGSTGELTAWLKASLPSSVSIDSADEQGNTPLHHGCLHGHAPIVKLLIDAGAPREKVNAAGSTPRDVRSRKTRPRDHRNSRLSTRRTSERKRSRL